MKRAVPYLLLLPLFAAGCATLTGGSDQSVSVRTVDLDGTEVVGAVCELSNSRGKWSVTTPGSVKIQTSNDDVKVVCHKPGYVAANTAAGAQIKSGLMFWNLMTTGPVGGDIDRSNGSAYRYRDHIDVLITAAPNRD